MLTTVNTKYVPGMCASLLHLASHVKSLTHLLHPTLSLVCCFFSFLFSLFSSLTTVRFVWAQIAEKYYGKDKLYVFNGLHNDPDGPTFEERDQARPVISNLFDTFVAVSTIEPTKLERAF